MCATEDTVPRAEGRSTPSSRTCGGPSAGACDSFVWMDEDGESVDNHSSRHPETALCWSCDDEVRILAAEFVKYELPHLEVTA